MKELLPLPCPICGRLPFVDSDGANCDSDDKPGLKPSHRLEVGSPCSDMASDDINSRAFDRALAKATRKWNAMVARIAKRVCAKAGPRWRVR